MNRYAVFTSCSASSEECNANCYFIQAEDESTGRVYAAERVSECCIVGEVLTVAQLFEMAQKLNDATEFDFAEPEEATPCNS